MNKYDNEPYKFYNDLCEAAELIQQRWPTDSAFAEVLCAIAGKFSEEGSTSQQDEFLRQIKQLHTTCENCGTSELELEIKGGCSLTFTNYGGSLLCPNCIPEL